jgi:hypothetical protein
VKVAVYGAELSRETRVPSNQNSIRLTRRLSLAVAAMFRVELNVAPAAGAEIVTVGAS